MYSALSVVTFYSTFLCQVQDSFCMFGKLLHKKISVAHLEIGKVESRGNGAPNQGILPIS